MHVPVTDAFDETDQLESLRVELTPEQIEWLEETAAERGLSVDHMLRSIITAQMRGVDDTPSVPEESGDGTSHSASMNVSDNDTATTKQSEGKEDAERSNPPSIVESLRSASERLQDLTEEEEAQESNLHDTLSRLRAHMGSTNDTDDDGSSNTPSRTMLSNENQSMFDMMDDE
jgi:seryl-tRNA synthetase